MEEKAVIIGKRFGDEQSNLLDQFERMSFEAHLKRAMQSGSISESGSVLWSKSRSRIIDKHSMAIPLERQVKQRRHHGSRFNKVLKNLIKPILCRKSKARKQVPDPCSTKMQAMKEKIQEVKAMRKAKADAKAEEKAEKELAKARMEIAREVRLAKEAEAQMDIHVEKAAQRADEEMAKHPSTNPDGSEQYLTTNAVNDPTYN